LNCFEITFIFAWVKFLEAQSNAVYGMEEVFTLNQDIYLSVSSECVFS